MTEEDGNSINQTDVDLWEAELDMNGPFAPIDVLSGLYQRAPEAAPSRGMLGQWINVQSRHGALK